MFVTAWSNIIMRLCCIFQVQFGIFNILKCNTVWNITWQCIMYCLFLFWIIGVLLSWQADCFQLPFYFVCCSFFVSLLLMYSLLVYYFLTTDPVVFEDLSATSWGTECFLGLDQGLRKVVESCCWSWKWQFLLTKCIVTCLLIKKIRPLRNTCCRHPYIHTHTRLTALFPGLPGWAGTRNTHTPV